MSYSSEAQNALLRIHISYQERTTDEWEDNEIPSGLGYSSYWEKYYYSLSEFNNLDEWQSFFDEFYYKFLKWESRHLNDFSRARLITKEEKDNNPVFMRELTGVENRYHPISKCAVDLIYKIGDDAGDDDKTFLTEQEASEHKVLVVDEDFMIIPNPFDKKN